MTLTTQRRPLAERLAAPTHSARTIESLADAVFVTLAVDVPFAFACLATTDPASGVATRAFKSGPLPVGDEEFAALEYGGPDINLFAEVASRPVPVAVLSVDTGGHPEQSRRFREFMVPRFGFTDEIRLVCRARGTVWADLAIYRAAGEPSFTAADGSVLAGAGEAIADAVRTLLFADAFARAGAGPDPAVILIDGADRATDMTDRARDLIDELGGWDQGSLPSGVLNVIALARSTGQAARSRVFGRRGRWLALQAMTLSGASPSGSVVVTVDAADQAAVGQMTIAARGLTSREQDVVRLVLQGTATKGISAALHLSPHTVQDHLKSVFAKLGVSSRRELIAQLVVQDEPAH